MYKGSRIDDMGKTIAIHSVRLLYGITNFWLENSASLFHIFVIKLKWINKF